MKINIKNINNFFTEPIDLFLCSASFEERCTVIAENLEAKSFKKAYICYNHNHRNNRENYKKLKSLLNNKSFDIKLDSNFPANTFNNLFYTLENCLINENCKNILIDITAFTHETLLVIFKIFKLITNKTHNIYLAYISALEYSVNEKDEKDKWLSKGIGKIRSIIGYSGLLTPSQKNHLIILFGFESDRTKKLINSFEFDLVSLGFGPKEESTQISHYQINYKRHKELLKLYPNSKGFKISLINPLKTKEQLKQYIKKYNNYNIVIAAMNNKLSTIGAGLLSLENENIQLCYVTANQYNINGYSIPSEDCYIFKLSEFNLV